MFTETKGSNYSLEKPPLRYTELVSSRTEIINIVSPNSHEAASRTNK